MKKLGFILVSLLLSSMAIFADNDKVTRDASVLPSECRKFLSAHFPETDISHIKVESNLLGTKGYDVIMTNGMSVEFDKSGDWEEIKARNAIVPVTVIPQKIASYIEKHFTGNHVVSIEKDWRKYEAKLTNGVELTFDRQGNLKKID